MVNIETRLIECYAWIDDYLRAHPEIARWRRSNHNRPTFTDAEVLTIALMQHTLGTDTLKRTYEIIMGTCGSLFPNAPTYKQWTRRLMPLHPMVGRLVRKAAVHALSCMPRKALRRLYAVDSVPIAVCAPVRHGRVRLLIEDGANFGKSSLGWFFGFKLHLLIHQPTGAILTSILAPGNRQDQVFAPALAASTGGGVLLGDDGYRGQPVFDALYEFGTVLVRPSDDPQPGHNRVSQLRQRVETTFSSLWRRFTDRVYARSWRGLWTSLMVKMLDYNLDLIRNDNEGLSTRD